MEFSFENNTIETVGAEVAKQASKRKRKAAETDKEPEGVKKQKLVDCTPLSTPASITESESSVSTPDSANIAFSSSTSRSATPQVMLSAKRKRGRPRKILSSSRRSSPQPVMGSEKKKGGRPRKIVPYPRNKQLVVKTKLRRDRPFKKELPCEIWQTIFGFCSPSFLLKVCTIPYFDEVLSRNEVTWELARQRYFDPDMPGPPPGLSEADYARLLAGTGCQECGETKTRRTYWAYQRRWCEACHSENIVSESKSLSHKFSRHGKYHQYRDLVLKCIPQAKYDSWGHYQWVGDHDEAPSWGTVYPNGQKPFYQLSRIDDLMIEFKKSGIKRDSAQADVDAFFNPKIAANEAYVSKLQAVEEWWQTSKMEEKAEKTALMEQRAKFYKEQALLMDPPLEPKALESCPSYERAAKIPREPTMKSWSILQDKLKTERFVAEEELAKKRHREDVLKWRELLRLELEENEARREDDNSPEQLFVSKIADAVIEELKISRTEIADDDLLHIFFRRIYDAYQDSDNKPGGKYGEYRLLMADVKAVYNKQFRGMVCGPGREKESSPAMLVKCPGCPNRYGTRFFGAHMRHVHAAHKKDGSELSRFSVDADTKDEFPWLYLEWPRNLPILAPHHTSTGRYDPDDASPYQYKDPVLALSNET